MEIKRIDNPFEALNSYKDYKYALIYELSRTLLCKCEDIEALNTEEITEARFFDEKSELHIVLDCDSPYALCVSDGESDFELAVVHKYMLNSRFEKIGKKLIVKKYLEKDADGQAMVKLTRLAAIE